MNPELSLLLNYPLILRRNHENFVYYGYIKIKDIDYRIDLTFTENKCHLVLDETLKPYSRYIKEITSKYYNHPVEFLDDLSKIISKFSDKFILLDYTELYRKILNEYSELRLFYINIFQSKISRDLTTIEITHVDEKYRKHNLTVSVNFEDSAGLFRITRCDLPRYQEELVMEPRDSLISLYENFLAIVDCPKMQMIFDLFDEIDKNCWVVDPERPTRRDLYRRIMIENNLSFVITFNSRLFGDLPQIKFLGPSESVKRYTAILNRNFINWNPKGDVLLELLQLLELDHFPRQEARILEEELLVEDSACCICFTSRLNDKLPEIVCSNASCNQNFHIECLYQWLCSLNAMKFYHEVHGNCPNCEKTIHCPLPTVTTN